MDFSRDTWEELCYRDIHNDDDDDDYGPWELDFEAADMSITENPPSHLLEPSLTKLSQIIQSRKYLREISFYKRDEENHPCTQQPDDPRLVATVCDALIQRSSTQPQPQQQTIMSVKFDFSSEHFHLYNNDPILPITNLMQQYACSRQQQQRLMLDITIGNHEDDDWYHRRRQIPRIGGSIFRNALRQLSPAVVELTLYECGLGNGEASALAEHLKSNHTTLTFLNLEGNKIGGSGAKALAAALPHNGTLTVLRLGHNWIGPKGGAAMGHALAYNSALQSLTVSGNHFRDEGAMALATGLRTSSLQVLYIASASIRSKGGVALGEALAFSPALEIVTLNYNSMGDEGAMAIARSLVRNQTIRELYLCGIDMNAEGACAIACALQSNTSLTCIDMSWNQIGDKGAAALANALKVNRSLKRLEMNDCSIGDEGAIALGEAIACNATLTYLSLLLGNRDITNNIGIAALAKGLRHNSTMTHLSVKNDDYCSDMRFFLRRNWALREGAARMKRFSEQDIHWKGKVLARAMKRYTLSDFADLTFLFLQKQVSTIVETTRCPPDMA